MGCPTVKKNMIGYHGGETQAKINAKTFLTKRLQYILHHINTVRDVAKIEWGAALKNFNIFKHISIDGTQIFQLHLCHSIINALKVLTIEQLFVIVDRTGKIRNEFNVGEQIVFDDMIKDLGGDPAVIRGLSEASGAATQGESKNGGAKNIKNQKGGNKIIKTVSKAVKSLKKEFMKIVMSDKPIIKEIDIFKHFLLTYGGQYSSMVIEPHTYYYVNNGDLKISGNLTNGEQLLYDDTELDNIIGEIFETANTVKIENISNQIVPQSIQSIQQNKEDVITLYNTMIQSGMNHTDAIKLGQDIITNGNLTNAVTLIRNTMKNTIPPTMIPPTMRTGINVSQIPKTFNLSQTQIPGFGGKKKRKKRRTRKIKRKKKRKRTRKKRRN